MEAPSTLDLSPPSGRGGQRASDRGLEPPARDLSAANLADLMTGCATGDQLAFAELYDLTVRRVYGTALRVLRSPEHAEEVTQEVYLEVWNQARRYVREKGSVVSWITTMAHRRAVDRVRSVTSEIARDERYTYTGVKRERDEVWESIAQKQDVERVRKALATLTPIQQQAVQLAYLDGLTQR